MMYASFLCMILLSSGLFASSSFAIPALPPRQQVEKGVYPTSVICNDHLVFMLKNSDNSPACVKKQTAVILEQHGWGRFHDIASFYGTTR